MAILLLLSLTGSKSYPQERLWLNMHYSIRKQEKLEFGCFEPPRARMLFVEKQSNNVLHTTM